MPDKLLQMATMACLCLLLTASALARPSLPPVKMKGVFPPIPIGQTPTLFRFAKQLPLPGVQWKAATLPDLALIGQHKAHKKLWSGGFQMLAPPPKFYRPQLLPLVLLPGGYATDQRLPDKDWLWMVSSGATLAKFGRIKEMIIPRHFPDTTYNHEEHWRWGYTIGFDLYRRFPKAALAFQAGIGFAQYGGMFKYDHKYFDSILLRVDSLHYKIDFRHEYLTVAGMFKMYPFMRFENFLNKLCLGFGAQFAFNMNDHSIRYRHNRDDLVDELWVQQQLRETLIGRMDLLLMVALGWDYYFSDYDFGLSVAARYNIGLKDRVETMPNGSGFRDPINRSTSFQLTVGAVFPFHTE